MRRAAASAIGGIALTLAALTFDATPLLVPGVAITLLALATPAWLWLAAASATIERDALPERVREQDKLESTVSISSLPCGLPGAQLIDPLLEAPVRIPRQLSRRRARRVVSVSIRVSFARRGLKRVDAPALVLCDPLKLARAVRRGGGPSREVLVLPRTEVVKWIGPELGRRRDPFGASTPFEPLSAADFEGLRPYRSGTPASRIYWPALARGAGLLERRLGADSQSRPLVVLDARCCGPGEDLDAAVRAASSLTLAIGGHRGCGLLLAGQRRPIQIEPDLAAWPAAHAKLAVVEGGPGVRPPALAPGARLGHLFYVAAAPLKGLSPTVLAAAHGLAVLVLPESLSPRTPQAPSFVVSGCRGYLLRPGQLQSAPRRARHSLRGQAA